MSVLIYCPRCGSTDTDTTIVHDDYVDVVACRECGCQWVTDPGADPGCRECGGSGNPKAATTLGPCSTCTPDSFAVLGPESQI